MWKFVMRVVRIYYGIVEIFTLMRDLVLKILNIKYDRALLKL